MEQNNLKLKQEITKSESMCVMYFTKEYKDTGESLKESIKIKRMFDKYDQYGLIVSVFPSICCNKVEINIDLNDERITSSMAIEIMEILNDIIKSDENKKATFIKKIKDDNFELNIYQCECGFHFSIDEKYFKNKNEFTVKCMNCKKEIECKIYNKS